MSEEKRKQIAPAVVLAQHGNKGAYKDLYIHYYKNIYFICRCMTNDAVKSGVLTAEIFLKMFETVEKLEDHTVFEQWFFSLAVNICRRHATDSANEEKLNSALVSLAQNAAESAKNGDKFNFEHGMMKIISHIITSMQTDEKVIFFYKYAAALDVEQIAVLEKISGEEVEEKIVDIGKIIDSRTAMLREYHVDIAPFFADVESTVAYISAKTFVPASVHGEVSEKIGINVNPYAPKADKKQPQEKKTESAQKADKPKKIFTKSDLILFLVVIAVSIGIFSAIKVYYESKNATETTTESTSANKANVVLIWNGAAASDFESGSGTAEDPYIISSGGQLAYLANLVNSGNSFYSACHYKLGSDIILNGIDDYASWGENAPSRKWTPIGHTVNEDEYAYFSGTFDGDGHTIYGMYVSADSDYAGLFGVIRNGVVKNLCVSNSYVNGKSYAGGIAGYFSSDSVEQTGFENCSFSGIVSSDGNNAGGIAGYFRADGSGNTPMISECCVSGSISAKSGFAGGIAGASEAATGNAKIINCFNAAKISSAKNAGGITGNSRCADGISSIEMCYNVGDVKADENAGGISGLLSCVDGEGRVNVQMCYMLRASAPADVVRTENNERLVSGNITELSAEEMLSEEKFSDFDFQSTWKTDGGSDYGYPQLADTKFVFVDFNEDVTV